MFFSANRVSSISSDKLTIESEWDNLKYENLVNLKHVVKLEQDKSFFVISHPDKIQHFAHHYGWKLHISVAPEEVQKAFDIAVPIIKKYCFIFKVSNMEEQKKTGENARTYKGTQITIYLEEQDIPVVTQEQALQMIEEINKLFSDDKNNIQVGTKPDSDVETISPYFSLRNDKLFIKILPGSVEYIPAVMIGSNFNPCNHPNPFAQILKCAPKPFDPLQHFESFEMTEKYLERIIGGLFIATLYSYLREHTQIDTMSEELLEIFLMQCLEYNGNIDIQFFKTPYQKNPEIVQAIKQSVSCIMDFQAIRALNNNYNYPDKFKRYFNSMHLSKKYPYNNSFKQLLFLMDNFFKNSMQESPDDKFRFLNFGSRCQWQDAAKSKIIKLHDDENKKEILIEFIKKGHFYNAEAAINELKSCCKDVEYIEILLQNDFIPAVQLKLAYIYMFEYQKYGLNYDKTKADEYLFKGASALLECSICLPAWIEDSYLKLLIKLKSLEDLQISHNSGNRIATVALIIIYLRDIIPSNSLPDSTQEKFADVPIDHLLAKTYLEELESNPEYAIYAIECNKMLEKFEKSSPDIIQNRSFGL